MFKASVGVVMLASILLACTLLCQGFGVLFDHSWQGIHSSFRDKDVVDV